MQHQFSGIKCLIQRKSSTTNTFAWSHMAVALSLRNLAARVVISSKRRKGVTKQIKTVNWDCSRKKFIFMCGGKESCYRWWNIQLTAPLKCHNLINAFISLLFVSYKWVVLFGFLLQSLVFALNPKLSQ